MNISNKVALVTGSTSGIGLGIARALAVGAGVLLNGFGDPALIEKLLAGLKSQCWVRAAYSSTDMSKRKEFPVERWDALIALFLCSPAAAQIRGIALPVAGGWTAQ
jgi:NAD(P)-dependent dehydrogenase (short-subunit alcohol dehydrogenase family)